MPDIKYAYLKGQTWLYRRNYPVDVAPVLGVRALKQSLKTGDVKLARSRAVEVIHINGVPTVEVDFRALHVNILSLEQGVELDGDPYDLADSYFEGVDRRTQRGYLKSLVLTAINAADDRGAYQAFRDNYPAEDPARHFKNSDLQRLLHAFIDQTPQLEAAMFNDQVFG